MSDTPISDSTPHNVADLGMRIRMIERELHAANSIIRQQQLLDEQNLRLQDRIKRLEDWKDSAMAVEREWDSNAISTMLGGQLGESQRVVIMREVPRLLERIKRLEEVGDNLSDCADQIGWTSCESPQWIKKAENAVKEWRKAKEAKS
jgi:DNA-binding transcriptional MerR regulator